MSHYSVSATMSMPITVVVDADDEFGASAAAGDFFTAMGRRFSDVAPAFKVQDITALEYKKTHMVVAVAERDAMTRELVVTLL